MTTLGNILLGLAALIYAAWINLLYIKTAPRGGDAVVGYAWSIIIGVLAFSTCLAGVVAIIGWKGGFNWVGQSGTSRFLLVTGGLLLSLLGLGFFAMREGIGFLPMFLRQLIYILPALIPAILLVSAAILLNDGWRQAVPIAVIKILLLLAAVPGLLALGLMMQNNLRNVAAGLSEATAFEGRNHQNHLNQIDSTDVGKDMVFLLVFTDNNHDKVVRERALAKIKSRPDWQEELVRRLQNDWAPEVFTFLASNEVDDKAMFAEPVRQGVLIQAKLIRESIRQCRGDYDLYPGRFSWEIERALRTVDKFKGLGTDYRPAVTALREALDEPTPFEKPRFNIIPMLDKWLDKN